MVAVGVGEEDAADGAAVERLGGGEDVFGGAAGGGVDESEAVGLGDEVAVHEAEAGELVGVGRDAGEFHGGLRWCAQSWMRHEGFGK